MLTRHTEAAEKIIRTEGLTFALASSGAGTAADLAQAREYLKAAICRALAAERVIAMEENPRCR